MASMEILGVQVLGVLFGLFMLYYTFLKLKRKEFRMAEFTFWLILWLVFLLLAVFPTTLDFIALKTLSFSRRMDFYIVVGFLFLIGLTFYNYSITKINQRKIESVVRKLAFKKINNKK